MKQNKATKAVEIGENRVAECNAKNLKYRIANANATMNEEKSRSVIRPPLHLKQNSTRMYHPNNRKFNHEQRYNQNIQHEKEKKKVVWLTKFYL